MKKNRIILLKWKSRYLVPFMCACFLLLSFGISAQTNIQGKVTDSKGESLGGVNVLVKNTRQGTVTDANGEFKMVVPSPSSTI